MATKKTTVLIDFDFLMYTDMGLYALIKKKYLSDAIFDTIVLKADKNLMLYMSLNRPNRNPLSIIMKEGICPDYDKLYNDIMEKNYKFITDNGFIRSSIVNFVSTATHYNTKDIGISILYSNDIQKDCIEKLLPNTSEYTLLNKNACNREMLLSFSSYYIKDLWFFKDNNIMDIMGKTIYVQSLRYNLNEIAEKSNEESEFYNVLNTNKIFITNLGNIKDEEGDNNA